MRCFLPLDEMPPVRMHGRSAGRPKAAYRRWAYSPFRGVLLAALPARKHAGCTWSTRHKKPTNSRRWAPLHGSIWTPFRESAVAMFGGAIRRSRMRRLCAATLRHCASVRWEFSEATSPAIRLLAVILAKAGCGRVPVATRFLRCAFWGCSKRAPVARVSEAHPRRAIADTLPRVRLRLTRATKAQGNDDHDATARATATRVQRCDNDKGQPGEDSVGRGPLAVRPPHTRPPQTRVALRM